MVGFWGSGSPSEGFEASRLNVSDVDFKFISRSFEPSAGLSRLWV